MMASKKTPTRKKRTKKKTGAKKLSVNEWNELQPPRAVDWPWPLRAYQQIAADRIDAGVKRQMLIWHRRAGKDVFGLSVARHESQRRIGGYVHFFPKHVQARRAIWQGIDPKKGQRFVDVAFADLEADRNNTEMLIEMMNGATWQMLGSDNYDRVVGSNLVGAVFSEWALCDPRAWDFIRPIIRENDGWVLFITTYRGRNHAWQMVQQLRDNPAWHVDERGVLDTTDLDGNRIITDADIEAERAEGMKESLIQQEYFCNPEATSDGAVYGKQVERLRSDANRQRGGWDPAHPVYAIWNLDLPIHASCIMAQPGTPPQILDAQTWHFVSLGEAMARANEHRWPVQHHVINANQAAALPHFADLGVRPRVVHSRADPSPVIIAQNLLERAHVDPARCELLLDALSGYSRREQFNSQAADLVYSSEYVASWHGQLAQALETWAQWAYFSGGEWGPAPNYSNLDRIARTIA